MSFFIFREAGVIGANPRTVLFFCALKGRTLNMAFSRKFLIDNGVPEDKVDIILAERNRTLKDYTPNSDIQAQIDAAVAEALKGAPADVTQDPAFIAMAEKAAKLEAFQGEEFAGVKAPYRDIVWGKLDHAENHKPYSEQITEMAATMPDLFTVQQEPETPAKPSFGADVKGSAPTGKQGPSFMDTWGFVPKK